VTEKEISLEQRYINIGRVQEVLHNCESVLINVPYFHLIGGDLKNEAQKT
jgi:hypothetical protein